MSDNHRRVNQVLVQNLLLEVGQDNLTGWGQLWHTSHHYGDLLRLEGGQLVLMQGWWRSPVNADLSEARGQGHLLI